MGVVYGPSKKPSQNWLVGILICLVALVLAAVFPVGTCCGVPPGAICLSNVKQLGMGLAIYMNDYDDRLPAADRWYDLNVPYIKATFKCPEVPASFNGAPAIGYAFNDQLNEAPSDCLQEPEHTVMVFDSANLMRNAADPVTSLVNGGRHKGGNNVAYADSHAKRIKWPESPGVTRPAISDQCRRTGKR